MAKRERSPSTRSPTIQPPGSFPTQPPYTRNPTHASSSLSSSPLAQVAPTHPPFEHSRPPVQPTLPCRQVGILYVIAPQRRARRKGRVEQTGEAIHTAKVPTLDTYPARMPPDWHPRQAPVSLMQSPVSRKSYPNRNGPSPPAVDDRRVAPAKPGKEETKLLQFKTRRR